MQGSQWRRLGQTRVHVVHRHVAGVQIAVGRIVVCVIHIDVAFTVFLWQTSPWCSEKTYQTVKNSPCSEKTKKQINLVSVDLLWGTFCFRKTYKTEKQKAKQFDEQRLQTHHAQASFPPFSTVLNGLSERPCFCRHSHRGVARLKTKARMEKKRAAFATGPSAVQKHKYHISNVIVFFPLQVR